MRGQELHARDKKVQKMTRDGLVEKNLTQGKEERVSGRAADADFGRKEAREPLSALRDADAALKWAKEGSPRHRKSAETPHSGTKMRLLFGESRAGEAEKRKTSPTWDGAESISANRNPEGGSGQENTGNISVRRDRKSMSAGNRGKTGLPDEETEYGKRTEDTESHIRNGGAGAKEAQRKNTGLNGEAPTSRSAGRTGKRRGRLRFEAGEFRGSPAASAARRGAAHPVAGVLDRAACLKGRTADGEDENREAVQESACRTALSTGHTAGNVLYWSHRYRGAERNVRTGHVRTGMAPGGAGSVAEYHDSLRGAFRTAKEECAGQYQRRKIRRGYAEAVYRAEKNAERTETALSAAGRVKRAMARFLPSRKAPVLILAGILLFAVCGSLFTSCASMLSGIEAAVAAACYTAEDEHIEAGELRYTEMETDLQISISNTEADHPGYDEYKFNIGEIGHNPYELMGYLSAVYGDFTYAQVAGELGRLFGMQYTLTREEEVEIRTDVDEDGEEYTYEWHVLVTALQVRPLSEIIAGSLPAGEPSDLYAVYMQTCGNRQRFGNPFDFAWIPHVTSPYGYRVHPISGEKNLHRGIDIGAKTGTPIRAVQDGRVAAAGDMGGYGLCVVIEDENGYRSKYAHCSSLSVHAGQEVSRGDVIASVGSTGNSTGPHLHLEVMHGGEYLNPYYYVAGGGGESAPSIPEYSGAAMGDGGFAAMLAEAERYLGYPYVWGGSSPSTSFDCSGFVSWVINQSGVGSVGRQTAQGLFNLCTPVAKEDLQPGDLVFFTGTYSSANPVTHVGIYVGGGRMIHCGDPISYSSIHTDYWESKYYCGGRLP